MKTVLQQLTDKLKDREDSDYKAFVKLQESDAEPLQVEKAKGKWYSSRDAWKAAAAMLEDEEKQIKIAWSAGMGFGTGSETHHHLGLPVTAEQYYNKNYK